MENKNIKQKSQLRLSILLSTLLALIILLTIVPQFVLADPGDSSYGGLSLTYYDDDNDFIDISINLNASGDDATEDGWTWDKTPTLFT